MGKVIKLMTEQVSDMATMLKSKENQGFFESLLVRSELESPIAQGHQGLLKEGSKPTNSGAAHVPQSNSPKEKEKGSDQVSPSLDQAYQPTTKGMKINTNTAGRIKKIQQ